MFKTLEEGSLRFHEAINNKKNKIKDTHQRERNKKKSLKIKRKVFCLQFSIVQVFRIFYLFSNVFGYKTLIDCVLLVVRSERSPKMLKKIQAVRSKTSNNHQEVVLKIVPSQTACGTEQGL
jgi:hypothetical protein